MNNVIDTTKDSVLEKIEIQEIKIKDFRKLQAYKLSIEYYERCLKIIEKFPRYEQADLGDQLRRSTKKLAPQIAEGNGSLYSRRELYFIGGIALGSLCESQAHLDVALISKFITKEEHRELNDLADSIKRLLIAYVRAMLKE